MSGFTLKEISEDRVIMVRGAEERLTVYLNDPQKPKQRDFAVQPPPAAQINPSGAQTPQPQAVAPQEPTKQTALPGQPSTAPKIPAPEQREATKQRFLDFFKGG
jgi:hypothetical protein